MAFAYGGVKEKSNIKIVESLRGGSLTDPSAPRRCAPMDDFMKKESGGALKKESGGYL